MSKTICLMDGDIFAYNAARQSEVEINWGDDLWTLHSHLDGALVQAQDHMESIRKECKADEIVFVWSCPTRHYWRNDINVNYKDGRRLLTSRAPLALKPLKEKLAAEYESYMKPHLEGDDVLGILATADWYRPEDKKIIVSIDKDMKTIPVWLFNNDKDHQPWKQTEEAAELYFLSQAIGGDMTDGYGGCRGVSPESAETFIKEPFLWEQYEHTFKSGPRKDTTELRWRKSADSASLYECIVSLFMKNMKINKPEAEALFLMNAQCARILHAHEYDWEKEEVKFWTPPKEMYVHSS